jgi:hypothetical protein
MITLPSTLFPGIISQVTRIFIALKKRTLVTSAASWQHNRIFNARKV